MRGFVIRTSIFNTQYGLAMVLFLRVVLKITPCCLAKLANTPQQAAINNDGRRLAAIGSVALIAHAHLAQQRQCV